MKESKDIQRILSHVRKAVEEYSMIENGDKIAVGISEVRTPLLFSAPLPT